MSSETKLDGSPGGLAADLMALATEHSSEKRVELLRRITNVYIDNPENRTTAEQYLFEEVVSRLVDKISSEHKAAASQQLSKMPRVPEELVDRLVSDRDVEVAGPFIRNYRDISERTLVRVAKSGSQGHLEAIAGREVVTPPVTDVVVVRGNEKVVRTLAGNSGAQFSEQGMTSLVGRSVNDPALQALIVERQDLTPGAIAKLLPLISSELANRLRGVAVEIDEAIVKSHIAEWSEERKKNATRTENYIEGVRKGDLRINDVVMEFIRAKRLLDAATVIAATIDLDRDYAFNILSGGAMDPVVLLMKSVDLNWPAVDGFLKLRIAKTGAGANEKYPLRRDYDAINPATAQRVLRFMKVRRAAAK